MESNEGKENAGKVLWGTNTTTTMHNLLLEPFFQHGIILKAEAMVATASN